MNVVLDANEARVDGWWRSRYAVRRLRAWHWDHNGKAVSERMQRRLSAAVTSSSSSLSTRLQGA